MAKRSSKPPILCKYNSTDYLIIASTLAIAIGEEFDNIDVDILAAFFATLSDQLALISSVNACPPSNGEEPFISPIPATAMTRNKHRKKYHKKKSKK